MKLFFGDSITEGSGSRIRFTDCLNDFTTAEPADLIENKGISGTTLGEYSIYPVDGKSLLSLLKTWNNTYIKMADTIILEYGINDVSAIMCDFTSCEKVIVTFVKAIDWIRQLNPYCKIHCLSISDDDDIISAYAELQCKYLENEYFKGYGFTFPHGIWQSNYMKLIDGFKKRANVIPMITDSSFLQESSHLLCDDRLHPNELGHKKIAETIKPYL